MVQFRWENLETFIPTTVPSCVVSSYKGVLQKSTTSTKSAVAHSQTKPLASTLNSSVGEDCSVTPAEQRAKHAVCPIEIQKIPHDDSSLMDQCLRPTPFFSKSFKLTKKTEYFLELPPLNADLGDEVATGSSNLFDVLKHYFAGYTGDAIYDIVIRGPPGKQLGVAVSSIVSLSDVNDKGMTAQLPAPYFNGSYWPTRLDSSTPPTGDFTVPSVLPTTTCELPAKLRVDVPFLCNTRYTPATPWPSPSYSFSLIKGVLSIWNSSDTEDYYLIVEIYRSVAPGTRVHHFTGMPPVYFDCLVNTTSGTNTYSNYSGTYYPLV